MMEVFQKNNRWLLKKVFCFLLCLCKVVIWCEFQQILVYLKLCVSVSPTLTDFGNSLSSAQSMVNGQLCRSFKYSMDMFSAQGNKVNTEITKKLYFFCFWFFFCLFVFLALIHTQSTQLEESSLVSTNFILKICFHAADWKTHERIWLMRRLCRCMLLLI